MIAATAFSLHAAHQLETSKLSFAAPRLSIPNESNFFMALGYAYSKELAPPTVSMTQSGGKIETNPELVVEPYLIEFTSLKKARVRVTWYLNM
ncbi:MAG TPA: hypothetical protein VHE60_02360 [Pyrinomonadaceae bacterium]|nr:hypothetical protein [Pyrinomonadaceae bacterium]